MDEQINYISTNIGRRMKISEDNEYNKKKKLSKDEIKKKKMNTLINKYYDKIINEVNNNKNKNLNEIKFYYNYYDFLNDRIGKPKGLFNEMMQEMCYEYSEYRKINEKGEILTLKNIFGNNFSWEHVDKNKILIKI